MKISFYLGRFWEPWVPADILERGLGGSETAASRMASALAARGHEVSLFGGFEQSFEHEKAHYYKLDALRGTECDVLVCSRAFDAVDVVSSGAVRAKAAVLWLHDAHFDPEDPRKEHLKIYDLIFCLTDWHRDEFLRNYPEVDASKVRVTRNGIDTKLYDKPPIKEGDRIIFPSSPNRGLDDMLELLPGIRERVPSAELHVFYGFETWQKIADFRKDPFEKAKIEYYKARLQTTERVTFHGRVGQRRLSEEFLRSKVFAYPTSWPETSCIAAMEAQAAECVPVATHIAALGETIRHGITLHGPPSSKRYKTEFVSVVSELLSNKERHSAIVIPGRRWALANLSWTGVAEQWESVFGSLVEGRSLPGSILPSYEEPDDDEIDSILVVLTCRRRDGRSYLRKTLEGLLDEGALRASRRVLLFDGPVETADVPEEVLRHFKFVQVDGETRVGGAKAVWRAMSICDEAKASKILFFEDDVEPCKNAVRSALGLEIPRDLGMVTFFDPDKVAPGSPYKIWRMPAWAFSCNQFIMLPRRTARWVSMIDPTKGPWLPYCGDNFLGRAVGRSPWPTVGVHIPCLVEHVGEVSAVWADASMSGRRATNYPGRDFDALSLEDFE